MMLVKSILGGIIAAVLATSAFADTAVRPIAREDIVVLRQKAEVDRLASFRVVARPDHMIRYPMVIETTTPSVRPVARSSFLPRTRWAFQRGSAVWTRAAMSAIGGHGNGLDSVVPRDIERWCPAYENNPPELRRAFWVGMMSALAKHESTFNPRAVGGGNLWFGLLQIYPDTARRYGCRAQTGEALMNPVDNLSCAARIMSVTVSRDNAIAVNDGRWRGVAADWGPMSNSSKLPEMAHWTREQSYCVPTVNIRPRARPTVPGIVIAAVQSVPQPKNLRPQARPTNGGVTFSSMNLRADQG